MPLDFDAVVKEYGGKPCGVHLNLGSGQTRRQGAVNVDKISLPEVDLVADVSKPLPFGAESVGFVEAQDVVEHLEPVGFLREIHRVLRPGGRIAIQAAHYTSRNVYVDPTHVTAFSSRTFDFFVSGERWSHRNYYFDFTYSKLLFLQIQFVSHWALLWNYPLERLVNGHRLLQDLYESTGLSGVFPAQNVIVVLEK